jgi:hypothetical protein
LIHCCILLDFIHELYYDARIHDTSTRVYWWIYRNINYKLFIGLKDESFGVMFLSKSNSLQIFYCCRTNTLPFFCFSPDIRTRYTNYVSLRTLRPMLTFATRTLDSDTYYVSSLKALMCGFTAFVGATLCAVCGYRFFDRLICRPQSTTLCQQARRRNPDNGRSWINFRLSAIKAAVVSIRIVYPLIWREIKAR